MAASSPFRDRLSCPSGSPWRRKGFGHTEAGGGGVLGALGAGQEPGLHGEGSRSLGHVSRFCRGDENN